MKFKQLWAKLVDGFDDLPPRQQQNIFIVIGCVAFLIIPAMFLAT